MLPRVTVRLQSRAGKIEQGGCAALIILRKNQGLCFSGPFPGPGAGLRGFFRRRGGSGGGENGHRLKQDALLTDAQKRQEEGEDQGAQDEAIMPK